MLNLASVDNLTFESSKMPCMLYQGYQGFHLLMKFSGILHHDTWQSAIKRTITVENEKKLAVQGNALQSLKDMFFVFFLCRKPNVKTWVFVCKRTREETFTLTSSPTPPVQPIFTNSCCAAKQSFNPQCSNSCPGPRCSKNTNHVVSKPSRICKTWYFQYFSNLAVRMCI